MSYFDSIYADTLLPPRAVSVYMYLKDRSNSAGSCWPGIKTIARDMNLSRSTVKRALTDLEQHGYLEMCIRDSFYDAAEGLLSSTILLLAEFLPPDEEHPEERRHIVSVFKRCV